MRKAENAATMPSGLARLGKLEVEIPPPGGGIDLETFLAEHPEHRERIEAVERWSKGLRRHAELVIGEI